MRFVIASETKQSVGLMKRSLKTKVQKKPHPSVIARHEAICWIGGVMLENQKSKLLTAKEKELKVFCS
jgi:hypothetical protein